MGVLWGWRWLQPLSLQPLSGKLHAHSLAPHLPSLPSTGPFPLLPTPAREHQPLQSACLILTSAIRVSVYTWGN